MPKLCRGHTHTQCSLEWHDSEVWWEFEKVKDDIILLTVSDFLCTRLDQGQHSKTKWLRNYCVWHFPVWDPREFWSKIRSELILFWDQIEKKWTKHDFVLISDLRWFCSEIRTKMIMRSELRWYDIHQSWGDSVLRSDLEWLFNEIRPKVISSDLMWFCSEIRPGVIMQWDQT